MYQYLSGSLFFSTAFFIQSDENKFAFEPAVGTFFVAGEKFAIVGTFNIRNGKFSGEFTVSDIKRANYSELFPSDEESADRWFKCKLIFITLDEKSGAEKKTSTQVLVQAADLRDAVKKLDEGMKGTMADYQIGMVSETPLMDVYPYSAEPNDKPEFDPSKA